MVLLLSHVLVEIKGIRKIATITYTTADKQLNTHVLERRNN